MASKDEREFDSGLTGGTDVPASEEDFSLEEILAEYGAGREQRLLADVEQEVRREAEPAASVPEPAPQEPSPKAEARQKPADPRAKRKEAPPPQKPPAGPAPDRPEDPMEELQRDLPPSPHPITLEDVVGSTVDAVMEEEAQEPLLRPRRGLFSRRRLVETEELYAPPEPEPEPEEIPEIDTIGPEPELAEAAADCRAETKRRKRPILAAALISLLSVIPMGIEAYGYEIRYWTGNAAAQSGVLLACLVIVAVLARQVFAKAFGALLRKRCTSELLAVISAAVMAADCAARLLLPERSDTACYAPVACFALVFAMWGGARESRGMWDTFRMAATDDEPPYLVTETEKGACKQAGSVPGFYTTALREDTAAVWQNALMPVVLVASIVFAGLSSLGQGRGDDFLLNWSAILGAGTTFALPLCWGMPFSRLARHFHKAGCAVAGWCGAEKISRRRAMILTDGDLFPPGTIQLNGVKVFGEDLPRVSSYAASMARAADCGLQRLFDGLLRGENGTYQRVDDFSFYEEGGYSGTIHGESVLMGTAWPGPRIGKRCRAQILEAFRAGHEIGFHAWDHHKSQAKLTSMSSAEMIREFERGLAELAGITGEMPATSASPGWRTNDRLLEVKAGFPFRYNSDCRGRSPFYPVTAEGVRGQLQIPVTLPTYDEAVGRGGVTDANYNDHQISLLSGELPNVLTIHAEAEGGRCRGMFDEYLARVAALGYEVIPLGELAARVAADAPEGRIELRAFPGREGVLAVQV